MTRVRQAPMRRATTHDRTAVARVRAAVGARTALEALRRPGDAGGAPVAFATLQRLAGNQAVLHSLQRKGDTKPAKPADPPPPTYHVHGSAIARDAEGKVEIGIIDGTSGWVTKGGVPLPTAAKIGTFYAGIGKPEEMIELDEVTLAPSDAGGATARSAKPTGVHGCWALGSGKPAFLVMFAPAKGSWSPVGLDTLKTKVEVGGRIDLTDGSSFWSLMRYKVQGEKAESLRWVPTGHPLSSVRGLEKEIDVEAKALPATVQARVSKYLKIISLVATHEGSFGATAGDSKGSLGIFQWSMDKDATTEYGAFSSMADFFLGLKHRAEAAADAAKRSDEDQLYIDAWKNCQDAGLTVQGKSLYLKGEVQTGRAMETDFHKVMGASRTALRRYQLVAAADWVEKMRDDPIRPGPSHGKEFLGNKYQEYGTQVRFTVGNRDIFVELPAQHLTVGGLFPSEKAFAIAVNVGVNRAYWVTGALWKEVSPWAHGGTAEVKRLLGELAAKQAATAPAGVAALKARQDEIAADLKKKDVDDAAKKTLTEEQTKNSDAIKALSGSVRGDIKEGAITAGARPVYEELQAVIWPTSSTLGEAALLERFKATFMNWYPKREVTDDKRERRFATVEAGYEAAAWKAAAGK